MFEATSSFTLFDYFRVPYERCDRPAELPSGVELLRLGDREAFVAWPTARAGEQRQASAGSYLCDAARIFASVAARNDVAAWQRLLGGRWQDIREVRTTDGTRVAAVSRRDDGSIILPFDPNEVIASFWSERYLDERPLSGRVSELARGAYYRARPLLPRRLQMAMRRSFSRVQSKAQFPRWPVETALHDFYDFLFGLLAAYAQQPIPYLSPWPREWTWAILLTHDVEGKVGYERLGELLDVEVELGYRSSWNFVPRGEYAVEESLIRSLETRGFEVGVHGLHHDGRDLAPNELPRRAPLIRQYAEQWRAQGFRSPATLRSEAAIKQLGFAYDSSYSDSAPFEPQAGGCCTWLPYMLGDVVELPITLVQDHTLFDLLGHADETLWRDKVRFLRDRGGMALFLTHPDYVGNDALIASYRSLLTELADDSTAWKPLPHEAADWWRRRADSLPQEVDGTWSVRGPAANDARVAFVSGST